MRSLEGNSVGCAYGRPAADEVPRFTNTRNLRLLLTFIEHRSQHFLALPSAAYSLGNRPSSQSMEQVWAGGPLSWKSTTKRTVGGGPTPGPLYRFWSSQRRFWVQFCPPKKRVNFDMFQKHPKCILCILTPNHLTKLNYCCPTVFYSISKAEISP